MSLLFLRQPTCEEINRSKLQFQRTGLPSIFFRAQPWDFSAYSLTLGSISSGQRLSNAFTHFFFEDLQWHTHTVRNNRVKEPTNQTNQKVKAMSMDPLQMWSHGTINTLLDGKQSSGTLKRKDICLLDKVISLFFLPLCVVCHTARCFFRTMWPYTATVRAHL